jgi:hypothetical protein
MKNTQWIYEMTGHSHDQYKVDLCNNVCVFCPEFLRNLGEKCIKVNYSTQGLLTNPRAIRF